MRVALVGERPLFDATRAVRRLPNNRDQAVRCRPVSVVLHKNRALRRRLAALGPTGEEGIRKARVEPVAAHLVVLCAYIDCDIGRKTVGRNHAGELADFRETPLRVNRIRQVFERLREVEEAASPLRFRERREFLKTQRVLAEFLSREGTDTVGIFRGNQKGAARAEKFPCRNERCLAIASEGPVKEDIVKLPGERRSLIAEFSFQSLKFSREL